MTNIYTKDLPVHRPMKLTQEVLSVPTQGADVRHSVARMLLENDKARLAHLEWEGHKYIKNF